MSAYQPADVFALDERVLAAPGRYVQGAGVLDRLGRYARAVCGPALRRAAVLVSSGGLRRPDGARALASLAAAGVAHTLCVFGGECTDDEIARHVAAIADSADGADALVAIGGGKCIDTGRCIASRLGTGGHGVPFVVCPTLASTNAACSACSVVYAAIGGRTLRDEFFRASPALVLVDTRPVLSAHPRYLAAGMGDAVAAAFEARAVWRNVAAGGDARTEMGARASLAARVLADAATATLMQHGVAAMRACASHTPDAAFDDCVEAIVLLSGVGFESGGLALAHAVAQGLTFDAAITAANLHGEMVAIGLLTQLAFEALAAESSRAHDPIVDLSTSPLESGRFAGAAATVHGATKNDSAAAIEAERERVTAFCASVGLPIHFGHLGVARSLVVAGGDMMRAIVHGTLEQSIAQHMRGGATAAAVEAALLAMDAYGRAFETRTDAANAANMNAASMNASASGSANASGTGAEREPCCHAWAMLRV